MGHVSRRCHSDQPCSCACSIWSSSGSTTGWSCSAGRRPPRTLNCSCCGTRSPCCAGPIRGPTALGRSRSPRRADPAPAGRRRCPAVVPPPGHPEVDLSEPDRTATGQRRDRYADQAARHREPRLGGTRIKASCPSSATGSAHPPSPRPQGLKTLRHRNGAPTRLRGKLVHTHTQASTMLTTDFFHVDCTVPLQRLYCLFQPLRGHLGITANPDGPLSVQQIRKPPDGSR